jgi:transposase
VEYAATYPTDVPTPHLMLDEQRQLIESLKANLHRLLRWQFGPTSEQIDVDHLGLFVDGSVVIEVPAPPANERTERAATEAPSSGRRRAVRVLRNLPRVIDEIDVPEAQKPCPCRGEAMSSLCHEASEQLHDVPARPEVHETRRKKYACGHCHRVAVRTSVSLRPLIPKSMASASLQAYLIVSKFADGLPFYRIAGRLRRVEIELSHTLMPE